MPLAFRVSHYSTLLAVIGYGLYWAELFWVRRGGGRTTAAAWVLAGAAAIAVGILQWNRSVTCIREGWSRFRRQGRPVVRIFLIAACLLGGGILLIALFAATFPPHLPQESDALNYHYTLPRQHLILHSFRHLPWSSGDLFLLPVDFALAPFWFATELPNKLPQFIFLAGLLTVGASLVWRLSAGSYLSVALMAVGILGSHGLGIQFGTAMLDLVIAYFFLAALDSFLKGDAFLCGIEAAFFVWSKPGVPLQFLAVAAVMTLALLALRASGITGLALGVSDRADAGAPGRYGVSARTAAGVFFVASLVIALPFIGKSLYYAGTPLYPFFPGVSTLFKDSSGMGADLFSLKEAARLHLSAAAHGYGSGTSAADFIRHLWLVAVPEQGVNNRYDYPLGLMYLIFIVPFAALFISSLRARTISLLCLLVTVSWAGWWFGVQQSRFLYIPLLLVMAVVSSRIRRPSAVFMGVLLTALGLNAVSVYRAHRADFGKSALAVLRQRDQDILSMNEAYRAAGVHKTVSTDYNDAAFAEFPIDALDGLSPWVLKRT